MFLFLSFFFSMLCCLLMILNFIDHLFGQMEPTQAKEIVTEAHAVQYDNISHVCTMIFRLLFSSLGRVSVCTDVQHKGHQNVKIV